MKNEYKTMGLPPKATEVQIKTRYLSLMRELHPDKGGTTEACAEISLAYAVLKDRRARAALDERIKISGEAECIECSGTGQRGLVKRITCKFCKGTGWKA